MASDMALHPEMPAGSIIEWSRTPPACKRSAGGLVCAVAPIDPTGRRRLISPGGEGPSFDEKLVVLGARHRNESAARESTLGFRSAPDRPEREGTLQRVGFHECAAKAA